MKSNLDFDRFSHVRSVFAGYDMMIEGGQSEGGDVQAKDMRTEINGGQDGNIEVTSTQLHCCQHTSPPLDISAQTRTSEPRGDRPGRRGDGSQGRGGARERGVEREAGLPAGGGWVRHRARERLEGGSYIPTLRGSCHLEILR